ncbi:MAG TPA: MFS transporter [Acidimicrobiales bacterium]|nr:MFS transporter [Acidimicrobiales bacterium]
MKLRLSSAPGRWTLLATVLGSSMASIDSTVVGIALPAIGRQFHASVVTIQWVVDGYLLTLAALLLAGGGLGDELGRKRIFAIGMAWFTVASAACALAPDASVLIVTRFLQGIGAALLTPGSLAIIEASFHPDDRGRAIGAWSGFSGLATAAGPLLGGYLISAASWRWIFLVNVPVALAALAVTARHVPESRGDESSTLDTPGATLTVVLLAGLTYALVEGPVMGWASAPVVGALSAAAAAGVAFVVVERHSRNPLVPLGVFRSRQFTASNLVTLLVYAALGGTLFLLPVQLEVVDRYSPLDAGMSLLPITALMLLLSARSGRLAARIGPRLQMSLGPLVVGAGLALLVRTSDHSSYLAGALPGVVVFAAGLVITVAPLTATAMGSVDDRHTGLASAFNNDVARFGGLIAVSVLPALSGLVGSAYLHPHSLAHGFRTAVEIAALWCVAGGLFAAFGIRNTLPAAGVPGSGGAPSLHCALDAPPLAADA